MLTAETCPLECVVVISWYLTKEKSLPEEALTAVPLLLTDQAEYCIKTL
jgi:hypothetical protein